MGSLRWGTCLATTTTLTTTLDTMMKLVVLAALVSLAAAQAGIPKDTNGDGAIDQSESGLEPAIWNIISCTADTNGDGKVDMSELMPAMSKMSDEKYLQKLLTEGCPNGCSSVSISMIVFSLASLMAMIWK